ncbi:MAG TPA: ribose 5-phosphate isomerase B [Acidimicrobiales bacterium]|jgi:ribose 5-phosphate isomerase B|nr:ribose 5-phosphate isomerase B [Acidimicrobiales bacterium]
MRIVLASDHAGFQLKTSLAAHITATTTHTVLDIGTHSSDPVDYPPICAKAARIVAQGGADLGVVMGGSGQGEQIAANKVRGARAALCHDEFTARFARRHNDANVLSLGARLVAPELAAVILDVFLTEEFEGGRHLVRVEQITSIEEAEAAKSH